MPILYHYPLCPQSRFVRLVLAEIGVPVELVEERPWQRRTEFLALNPAGTTPVLTEGRLTVPGATVIAEFLDETHGPALGIRRLMPADPIARVEVRRLVQWFTEKFGQEVSEYLVSEKICKRFMAADQGGGPPNMDAVRAARANVRYHMRYVGYLIGNRNWLGGDTLSYADLAAAAHFSCVDYLGDLPWDEDQNARDWYARVKSRPAFRTLLADRIPGIGPSDHYDDLDF